MTVPVPHHVTGRAYTTAGDISRITSTLSGVTTFASLVSAEQAAARSMDNLRAIRASIRTLKREARANERRVVMA